MTRELSIAITSPRSSDTMRLDLKTTSSSSDTNHRGIGSFERLRSGSTEPASANGRRESTLVRRAWRPPNIVRAVWGAS